MNLGVEGFRRQQVQAAGSGALPLSAPKWETKLTLIHFVETHGIVEMVERCIFLVNDLCKSGFSSGSIG